MGGPYDDTGTPEAWDLGEPDDGFYDPPPWAELPDPDGYRPEHDDPRS
jgi:hypothetical protein